MYFKTFEMKSQKLKEGGGDTEGRDTHVLSAYAYSPARVSSSTVEWC